MTKNPWLSLWLSAANTWAGAARGFWTAEMQRQHKALSTKTARSSARPATKRSASKKASTGSRRKSKG